MRLKSIKLVGFKSFVDATVALFPNNLSAVVGPNGCGKSNIIDAVRWVLGESSAKNLRGESMTDVIFNGSNSRKPVTQASIELVFDNQDGSLGGEYAQYAEISIKRIVTRDSQSTYYLNGTKCRRKDVTDIFLGTGLGPRSYAIIEQGMISRLVESKPAELRVFIEEAAGISKYKERRRETESRMKRTRENLERLEDLREELGRQLQHLHRQSVAAEKYKQHKEEERLLKAQLQALKWSTMDSQVQASEQVIRDLEVMLEKHVAEQRHVDAEIESYREHHTEQNDKFNEIQGRFYSLGAEIARIEQSIQHQNERHQQLQTDLLDIQNALSEAQALMGTDTDQVDDLTTRIAEIEPDADIAREAEEAAAEAMMEAEENMQQWQSKWDAFNQTAAEPRQRAEVEQSRIQHLEQSMERLSQRIERLGVEEKNLTSGPLSQEVEELSEQVVEMDLSIEEMQAANEGLFDSVNEQRDSNRSHSLKLDENKSKLQQLKGRHASLEALQQAATSEDSATESWLSDNSLDQLPRVSDQLSVQEGWEKAVETVLGNHLQAVCVDGIDSVASVLDQLEHGSVALLDVSSSTPHVPANTGKTLLSCVNSGEKFSALLAGVYVADNLNEALQLRSDLSANESVITSEGVWVGRNWLRVMKDKDAQAGVLQRKQELITLSEQIETLESENEEINSVLEQGRTELRSLELQREEKQKVMTQLNRDHGELNAQMSAKQVRLEQITMRRERLTAEIKESEEQQQLEKEQMSEARLTLQDAIDLMENDAGQREDLLRVRDETRQKLDDARQKARHDKDNSHRLNLELQSYKTQLDSIRQGMERIETQTNNLNVRKEMLDEQMRAKSDPDNELTGQLEVFLEQRLEVEEQLSTARRELENVEHALRDAEGKRSSFEADAQKVRDNLNRSKMEWQGLQVQRKTVQEQLAEQDFDVQSILEELPEEANESEWSESLEKVAARISRLGPINLAAIEEYKAQSERKEYLDSQNEDLNDALKTLENAIRKIDKETRTRFKETFDKINKGLQELFPKVFGGGHAYLEMIGDDLLDTGIAIMARPPGKRNSTIHLLSGGEKALTALALVFSIFRLNPAPFCMLDEVDAPLDDANVGRFCKLVKEMSTQVQFIYISHNKIAMEMADSLMGVTMHEPGASRLVSVDVEEAAEMAAL